MKETNFSELIGQTIIKISGCEVESNEIVFETKDCVYKMYHIQDCCEEVYVEDVIGDINDLIGTPIIIASEDTNKENPSDINVSLMEEQESFLWTFYNIATLKGHVTIRWYGSSNGYYSESVILKKLVKNNKKF